MPKKPDEKIRDQHVAAGFDAEQLFAWLSKLTPAQRRERRVFIRVGRPGHALNVKSLDTVTGGLYGHQGEELPCVVLGDGRLSEDGEVNHGPQPERR